MGIVSNQNEKQSSKFWQELEKRVLIYDGAMGTQLMERDLQAADFGGAQYEGCNEYLVLTRPDVIEDIHAAYFSTGCDVVETDSFTGSRLKLDEYGLAEKTYEINYQAAAIARRVADRFTAANPANPRFVAGSIGPTGFLPSSEDPVLGNVTFDKLVEVFTEQARALLEGGADVMLIETSQDILEVKAAIFGIREARQQVGRWVPIQAQVSLLDTSGRMLLGTDIAAVMVILESLGADIIGLNCSTGPENMRDSLRYLAEHSKVKLSCLPNAGLPLNEGGRTIYPMTPEPMTRHLTEFVDELGLNIVGGCCGTTPAHIKMLVDSVGNRPAPDRRFNTEPMVASAIRSTSLHQEPAPLLVGERVNSQGSKKVKQLLLASDYEGLMTIAREQVEGGAHTLDVCVALTERADETEQMRRTIKKLSTAIEAPLVIDSTEADTIAEALKNYPGRAIVNSINMERGRERIDSVMPSVRDHGAAVIALTIDEEGMAHTAEKKLAIAQRLRDIVHQDYGQSDDALIFDVLTFPVTTGQEDLRQDAYETLEGIRQVKQAMPEVLTILGVSNVSFGVKPHARAVLNSVFLHHAVQAGLDLAIVNPVHIKPYAEIPEEQRKLCDDLIFNTDLDALPRFIQYFEENAAGPKQETEDTTAGMSCAEKIHFQILHRRKEGIETLIDEEVINRGAIETLNEVLLPAMKEVGDKFGAGELILPFVLQSAEVMKKSVAQLERYLEKKEGYTKGKVVIATVFGDVHDIGKSLVNTILTNNGYTVYDLGKQVPVNTIIDKAVEVGADAIGLSALLVSTSKQMPLCIQELQRRGLNFPVLIGGAAINRSFGYRTSFIEGNPDKPYAPGVFYCKDAFEGLDVVDKLTDAKQAAPFKQKVLEEARTALAKQVERDAKMAETQARIAAETAQAALASGSNRPSGVEDVGILPKPPFWGFKTLEKLPLDELFKLLDLNTLFRLHWGGGSDKKRGPGDYERLVKDEFEPLLAELRQSAEREGFLTPKAIYGYFPCRAEGEDVLVFDSNNFNRELTRFSFPRQPGGEKLCLADYFSRKFQKGQPDVLPLQIVTAGQAASEYCEKLNKAGDYSRAYFVHGLASSIAEAAADYVHNLTRQELGLAPEQGKRYSWGYPACPDLADQQKLFELMPVTDEIGVSITEAHQLDPEQSTAALVVHHPAAKYYSTIDREALGNLR